MRRVQLRGPFSREVDRSAEAFRGYSWVLPTARARLRRLSHLPDRSRGCFLTHRNGLSDTFPVDVSGF